VSEGRAEPWFQWHCGNGCVEPDGSVRLDFARFDDFIAINEVLREVPSGRMESTAYGRLWSLRLDPKTGKVLSNECVLDRDCEFPLVPAAKVGQPWQHTYVLMHRDGVKTGEDWFGAIGRFDYETGELKQVDLGAGNYGSEALHVADTLDPDQGWLLDVVYHSVAERSELWVFDALTMGEPVCRLALPGTVPIGFHGTWQAA
jgi:carotenoid cleavage dioxygenase-like enzyme